MQKALQWNYCVRYRIFMLSKRYFVAKQMIVFDIFISIAQHFFVISSDKSTEENPNLNN